MRAGPPFVVQLERFRRRLLLVTFARYAWLALAAAIVTSEVVFVLSRPSPGSALVLVGVTAAAALAGAALMALVRRPTLRSTAAALDRALRLEDRLVTAMQCLAQRDAMAHLVVRDASARIAGVVPAGVFPFEEPVHRRAIGAAIVGVPVAIALLTSVGAPRLWQRAESDRDATSASALETAQPAARARAGTLRPTPGDARVSAPVASHGGDTKPVATSLPAEQRASAEPGAPGSPRSGAPQEAPAPAPAVARGASPQPADAPRPPPDNPAGQRGGTGAGNAAARRSDAGAPGSPKENGRGAGGSSTAAATGAGGVSGSALARGAGMSRPVVSPSDPAYAARYRDGWARAEAALAQQRVPSDLRMYVRSYFVAIRPSGKP